jgi:hypothetical protein
LALKSGQTNVKYYRIKLPGLNVIVAPVYCCPSISVAAVYRDWKFTPSVVAAWMLMKTAVLSVTSGRAASILNLKAVDDFDLMAQGKSTNSVWHYNGELPCLITSLF